MTFYVVVVDGKFVKGEYSTIEAARQAAVGLFDYVILKCVGRLS